jgi:TupA-like ATPgrasp
MELTLPFLPVAQKPDWRTARINLTYLWRHGQFPDLENPESFTELVQLRKMNDRDARLPILADKVAVKKVVAERIGSDWVIPTLWHGEELPRKPEWPLPFVLKARHGCNQSAFVHTEPANWDRIRRKAARWLSKEYGFWLDEWLYSQIPRGLIAEPFVGNGRILPVDYKFYVFGGRVEFVQVHLDRGGRHRWMLFDRQWHRVSSPTADPDMVPPANLTKMIEAAEDLGRTLDFVRVDLYEVDSKPLFGEMTFYPGSGLDRFDPVSLDRVIGAYWTRAKDTHLHEQSLTFSHASP